MKSVYLYTDGACANNQSTENVGGWGSILVYQGHEKELYGGAVNTTNNIMELTAIIEGLKALKTRDLMVHIFSDSAYVVNCFHQKWYVNWRKRGWKTSKNAPVENRALWEELLQLVEGFHEVHFFNVKGHLNVNDEREMSKWYKRFNEKNPGFITREAFEEIVEKNHRADELANIGMMEIKS